MKDGLRTLLRVLKKRGTAIKERNDILLTFTGFHDPYHKSLIDGEELEGPILSLLSNKKFKKIILFSTPNTVEITENTRLSIQSTYPDIKVLITHLSLNNPTDYLGILRGLRNALKELEGNFEKANSFVCTASGTPQMHACWLLLIAGGELAARILQIQPKQFANTKDPLIKEINIFEKGIPTVRAPFPSPDLDPEAETDFRSIIESSGMIGDHPSFINAAEKCAMLAEVDCPILILGQSGTGKEMFANMIHKCSSRKNGPFIPVNCAAIPEELAESVLFGHKKGAFTGATKDQKGKIALADKGTLFLDELGELSHNIQAKLLRVLQDKIVEPLGEEKGVLIDTRIVAATNLDLNKAIAQGDFREDLYYRLNIGEVYLPQLSERATDIPKLALYFLDKANRNVKNPKRITPDAIDKLMKYDWPGNIRQLSNIIERAVIITKGGQISGRDLEIPDSSENLVVPALGEGFELDSYMKKVRKRLFSKALSIANGNKSKAAKLLGVSAQAVYQFAKEKEI